MTTQRPIRLQPQPPIAPLSAPSALTTFTETTSPPSYTHIFAPRPNYAAIGHLQTVSAISSNKSSSSNHSRTSSSGYSIALNQSYSQHQIKCVLPSNLDSNPSAHLLTLPTPARRARPTRPLPALPGSFVSVNVQDGTQETKTVLLHVSDQPASAPAYTASYGSNSLSHVAASQIGLNSGSFVCASTSTMGPVVSLQGDNAASKAAINPCVPSSKTSSLPDDALSMFVPAPVPSTAISAAITASSGLKGFATFSHILNKPKRKAPPAYNIFCDPGKSAPSTSKISRKPQPRPTLPTLQIPQSSSPSFSISQPKLRRPRPSRSHSSLTVHPPTSPTIQASEDIDPRSPKSFRTVLSIPSAPTPLLSRAVSRRSSASSLYTLSATPTPTPSLFPLPPPASPNALKKAWEELEPKFADLKSLEPTRIQSSTGEAAGDVEVEEGPEHGAGEAYLSSSSSDTVALVGNASSTRARSRSRSQSHSRSRCKSKSKSRTRSQLRIHVHSSISARSQSPMRTTGSSVADAALSSHHSFETEPDIHHHNRQSVPLSVSSGTLSFASGSSSYDWNIPGPNDQNLKLKMSSEDSVQGALDTPNTLTNGDVTGASSETCIKRREPRKEKSANYINMKTNMSAGCTGLEKQELRSSKSLGKLKTNDCVVAHDVVSADTCPKKDIKGAKGRRESKSLGLKRISGEIPCPPLVDEPLSLIYTHYGLAPPSSVIYPSNPKTTPVPMYRVASFVECGVLNLRLRHGEKMADFIPKFFELHMVSWPSLNIGSNEAATRIVAAYDQVIDETGDYFSINRVGNEVSGAPKRAAVNDIKDSDVMSGFHTGGSASRLHKIYLIPVNDEIWSTRLSFLLPRPPYNTTASASSPPSSSSSSSMKTVILPVTPFPTPHAPSLPLLLLSALGLKSTNAVAAAMLPSPVLTEFPASINILAGVFLWLEDGGRRRESKSVPKRVASYMNADKAFSNSSMKYSSSSQIPSNSQYIPDKNSKEYATTPVSSPSNSPSVPIFDEATSASKQERMIKSVQARTNLLSSPRLNPPNRTNSVHGPRPRPPARSPNLNSLPESGPRSPPLSSPGTPAQLAPIYNASPVNMELHQTPSFRVSSDAVAALHSEASTAIGYDKEDRNLLNLESVPSLARIGVTGVNDLDLAGGIVQSRPGVVHCDAVDEVKPLHESAQLQAISSPYSTDAALASPQKEASQLSVDERLLVPASHNFNSTTRHSSILCALTTQNFGLWTNSLVLGIKDPDVAKLVEVAWSVVSEAGRLKSEHKSKGIDKAFSSDFYAGVSSSLSGHGERYEKTGKMADEKCHDRTQIAISKEQYLHDSTAPKQKYAESTAYPLEEHSEVPIISLTPRPVNRDRSGTINANRTTGLYKERSGTITRTGTLVGPRQRPPNSHSRSSSTSVTIGSANESALENVG